MKYIYQLLTACLCILPNLALGQINFPDYTDNSGVVHNADGSIGEEEDAVRLSTNKKLTIIATGKMGYYHSETIDGYTIVLNIYGDYEYAKNDKSGDLVPAGILAHNPVSRSGKEEDFLRGWPKHLFYSGNKLKEINKLAKDNKLIDFTYHDETDSITQYGVYVRKKQRTQRPGTAPTVVNGQ